MELKLILKDSTAIDLADAGYNNGHYVVNCANDAAFRTLCEKLTEENLSEIQVTEDGEILQAYRNSKLKGTQTINNDDGTVTGHFYLNEGERVRDEYADAGRILLGKE